MSAIKRRGYFRIFQFTSAIPRQKIAKYLAETFAYYVSNGLGIPQHLAKGYDLVF